MIIADTSALLAFFNAGDANHLAVRTYIDGLVEPMVVSPFVVAEVDYMVATRLGVDAELRVLEELASGAYVLAQLDAGDLDRCRAIIDRYADQEIGVADASLVVLAHQHGTRAMLTLDRRHFDVLRPLDGGRFRVLPDLPSSVTA